MLYELQLKGHKEPVYGPCFFSLWFIASWVDAGIS